MKPIGKQLLSCVTSFYQEYASWALSSLEKSNNLKYLATIMRISEVATLTLSEEQQGLFLLTELREGLQDGTIRHSDMKEQLIAMKKQLTERNIRSHVVSQVMEINFRYQTQDLLQHTLHHIIERIPSVPSINVHAIARELTVFLKSDALSEKTALSLQKSVAPWI